MSALPAVPGTGETDRLASIALAVEHVPASILAREPALLLSKWPGYRFLCPWEATAKFAQLYIRFFGYAFPGGRSSFEVADGSPEFVALWEMRQGADRLRMPYEDTLRIAFSLNRRNPKPFMAPHKRFNRLDRHKTFQGKARKEKSELASRLLSTYAGPQYRVEAFCGLPAQGQFRRLLIVTGGVSRSWERLVRDDVVRRRLLPAESLKGLIDPAERKSILEQVGMEISLGQLERESFAGIVPHELWQTCYGLPGAYREGHAPCAECPAAKDCITTARTFARGV